MDTFASISSVTASSSSSRAHPPYVLMRSGDGYVFLNFEDPDETTALYRHLEALWRAARAR
jgi:hypothetical protein